MQFRLVTEADAEQIRAIYGPFCERTTVSFEASAPSVEEMQRRIRNVIETLPWLVAEDEGRVAGYVYATPHRAREAYRWGVEVTVYIHEDWRRRQLGRSLYTSLFEMLRHLGYFKAFAGTTLPNPGSVGLHRAMGFEEVGVYRQVGYKLGAWHDVAWFQLQLQPAVADPTPPRILSELMGTAAFEQALATEK